jgi:hypothetical protein
MILEAFWSAAARPPLSNAAAEAAARGGRAATLKNGDFASAVPKA